MYLIPVLINANKLSKTANIETVKRNQRSDGLRFFAQLQIIVNVTP